MSLERKSDTLADSDAMPLWRKHFPIDLNADASRSRREFLGGAAVAGGTMACGQVALNQFSPTSSDSGTHAMREFAPLVLDRKLQDVETGEALLFHYPNEKTPCLLIKLGETEFVAFAQKCTHLACPVVPDVAETEFHCPCHHGVFDLRSGQPIAGPPRAKPAVRVEVADDGTLTATGLA